MIKIRLATNFTQISKVTQISEASAIHKAELTSTLSSRKGSAAHFKSNLLLIFGNIFTTLKITRIWPSVKKELKKCHL